MKPQTTEKYQAIYRKLNPAQKEAVDTIEGPVLVVAGPGTGKTQVLSARIANILQQTDALPQNILALTFTQAAAENMKSRVTAMIGTPGFSVDITTFHSFCAGVIARYPEYFPIDRDSACITDIERYQTFHAVILELPLELLKPLNAPLLFLRDCIKAISDLKREGITPSKFAEIIEAEFDENAAPEKKSELLQFQKNAAKNRELLMIFERYQEKLREKRRYDFDDMIAFVVEAFSSSEELLLSYQEQYQYILVDEYQDTNTAQNKVVDLLGSYWQDAANVFVVGDPHQSIYRFQGASTENVVAFTQRYPRASVITLLENYRSPQELVSVAHTLIQQSSDPLSGVVQTPAGHALQAALQKELHAQTHLAQAVEISAAPSVSLELIQVAEEIQKQLAAGVQAEEIAILYRKNKDAVELCAVLDRWNIPYEIDGGSNVLDFPPLESFISLFHAIAQYKQESEDSTVFTLQCQPWLGLDTISLYHLAYLAGKNKTSLRKLVEQGYSAVETDNATPIDEAHFTQIAAFYDLCKGWLESESRLTFAAWFETVLVESGYLEWVKAQDTAPELLLYLNTLHEQVKSWSQNDLSFGLKEFLHTITIMREYKIVLPVQELHARLGAVHLSTVHKAKGREWQYVYVIHCNDGIWGNTKERVMLPLPQRVLEHTSATKSEKMDEERRLFYVALTRARRQCFLSYSETSSQEGSTKQRSPSVFLHEIQTVHSEYPTTIKTEPERQVEFLARLVSPATQRQDGARAEAFFKKIVENFSLSSSALTAYLQDPQAFIFSHLLRFPTLTAPYLAFGTAIHAALENLLQQHLVGAQELNLESAFSHFQTILEKEMTEREDSGRRLQHGRVVLETYLRELNRELVQPWKLEVTFGSGSRKTFLDDIPLVGRIDRLDWIDRSKKLVRVIDYKTGTPKSRNFLEGKTESSILSLREKELPCAIRSPYQRQLLFYKLLTQTDPTFSVQVPQGVFEFVEPDKKTGKITSHQFDLDEAAVEELKQLIRTVMAEIRSLEFLQLK